jgi:transcriptional regulator with XRE-family HTH domain
MSMSDFKIDEFGTRLLLLIKFNNLNQGDFANRLSASPSFVSDLIRGVKKPGTDILIRIKKNFNVSIDWLLFGEGDFKEEYKINTDLFKTIALRVDLVKAALSGNIEAKSALTVMCPSVTTQLDNNLSLSYLYDGEQVNKDIDIILKLYVLFLDTPINENLYEKIIESAVLDIINNPVDPLLGIMKKNNKP